MKKAMKEWMIVLGVLSVIVFVEAEPVSTKIIPSDPVVEKKPNILLVYADDLGPGMLGCYGQKDVETPNIDKLAAQGLKFTNFYGCNVCAPARASLLSGLHTGHAPVPTSGGLESSLHSGGISEAEFNKKILSKRPVSDFDSDYLGEVAQKAGYRTSYFGKLGIGFTDTHQMMRDYGFDYYRGLLDSVICWSFYPEYYWENDKKIIMPGNPRQTKRNPNIFSIGKASMTYSEDVWLEKALDYLDEHRDDLFFMIYATQLPHGPVSIAPKDYKYKDRTDWTENERLYASMIYKLDTSVGALLDKLDELGIAEDTLVLFTSDNGHEPSYYRPMEDSKKYSHNTWDGLYHGDDRFNGTLGKRGGKRFNFDGGVNVPFIASWPGKILAGSNCDNRAVVYDIMPTVAEIGDVQVSHEIDGISFLSTLLGEPEKQQEHEYIYWAGNNAFTRTGIIAGDWKLIEEKDLNKSTKKKPVYQWALYDLNNDPVEKNNLAKGNPERMKTMLKLVRKAEQPLR